MKKLIREGRFGPPKSYKTGAVVSSYPQPMLVLEYDTGGLDVVKEAINFITVEDVDKICRAKTVAPLGITAVALTTSAHSPLTETYAPTPDDGPFKATITVVNSLVQQGCPWATVVLDPITGLTDSILSHISKTNATALADARKWAGNAGAKVKQIINYLNTLPSSHVVVIFHSQVDKSEITGEIRESPLMYSAARDTMGAAFSQWFYATKNAAGEPIILTNDKMFVKGIGTRWPQGLPKECKPLFNDIYKGCDL